MSSSLSPHEWRVFAASRLHAADRNPLSCRTLLRNSFASLPTSRGCMAEVSRPFYDTAELQLNWIKLSDMPQVLEELAEAGVHAIQNVGQLHPQYHYGPVGGVAPGENQDPRFWAEIVRQWSTHIPEFSFLPRKFKIAITGAPHDRAAIKSTTSACA